MKETSKEAIPEDEAKKEIIRKRIEEEADKYILPAYYTDMAMDFDHRIAPAIERVLEITMKDGLSEDDKGELIDVLSEHNLPESIKLEAIKKIEPDLTAEDLKIIEKGINTKKNFLKDYVKKYKES